MPIKGKGAMGITVESGSFQMSILTSPLMSLARDESTWPSPATKDLRKNLSEYIATL